MKLQYDYDNKIAEELYRGILKGVSVSKIYDKISHWVNCPQDKSTIYVKYKKVIAEARVAYDERILGYADERMKEGSDKLIELALRSKVGWNPTTKIQEVTEEDADENLDALSILMEKLGKNKEE
jgi:hypothetical protein